MECLSLDGSIGKESLGHLQPRQGLATPHSVVTSSVILGFSHDSCDSEALVSAQAAQLLPKDGLPCRNIGTNHRFETA